jgi:Tfp pilus assembly major pilin PilA
MEDRSSFHQTRRRFVSVLAWIGGTVTLSGCATRRDNPPRQLGATDVVVVNDSSSHKTVTVTITDVEANEIHTDRAITTAPRTQNDSVNDGKLPLNTDYRIEVNVENGPAETFEWDDPVIDRAPLWIRVDDSRNITFLLQAG